MKNKKLLTEQLAKRVKTFVTSSLNEEFQKDVYNAIMEYRIVQKDYDTELTDDDLNRARFQILYDKWFDETYILSNTELILTHPAFREIVAMGEPAVKYILEKLEERPSFIMYALPEILGYSITNWKEDNKILSLDEQCKKWKTHLKKLAYEPV